MCYDAIYGGNIKKFKGAGGRQPKLSYPMSDYSFFILIIIALALRMFYLELQINDAEFEGRGMLLYNRYYYPGEYHLHRGFRMLRPLWGGGRRQPTAVLTRSRNPFSRHPYKADLLPPGGAGVASGIGGPRYAEYPPPRY